MNWKGYLKLLGLFLVPLACYHCVFHRGAAEQNAVLEAKVDGLRQEVSDLVQLMDESP